MAVAGAFVTSATPFRSTICPRGACTRTVRNELAAAWFTYFVPASTCSAQRRSKRTAKMTSIATPRTLTRRRRLELGRYGSTTLLLRGRKRFERGRSPAAVVLAKELHLGGEVGALAGAKKEADQRVHRRGEHEVHHDRRREASHHSARRCALAEHELDDQDAVRIQERDHRDREERRMPAVASRGLAVAPDPVTGQGQHE